MLVLFIIPVTSPKPVVVADAAILSVFMVAPSIMSNAPLVADGFAAGMLKMPFTVKLSTDVIPPVPDIVILFIAPIKSEFASIIADELLKVIVEFVLLASIFPLVFVGEVPPISKFVAAMLSVPDVKVSKP